MALAFAPVMGMSRLASSFDVRDLRRDDARINALNLDKAEDCVFAGAQAFPVYASCSLRETASASGMDGWAPRARQAREPATAARRRASANDMPWSRLAAR